VNPRNTGILAILALALAAFVYFYEIRGEGEREAAREAEKRLFPGLEAEAIEEVRLTPTDGGEARLVREEGAWRMREPVDFPADTVAVDGIASTLAQLVSDREISEPGAATEYGLGEDARIVRFRAGGVERGLRLGKKAPVGGGSYVSLVAAEQGASGAKGSVYLVPTFKLNSLLHTVDDLRDRRVMNFDLGSVDRIEASWPDGGVVLERGAEGWRLVEPLETEADQAEVNGLLSDLAFLRAESFIDSAPDDLTSGLDAPEFVAVLRIDAGEGEARSQRFELGSLQSDGKRVARGAQPSLYRVRGNLLDALPRDLVAYRFKELASFDPSEAQSFEIAFHEASAGQTTLLRGALEEGVWTTSPQKMAAGRAAQLVASLASLGASDIVAESMGPDELAAMGLDPPAVAIRVEGAPTEEGEAPVLAEVVLGQADPARGIAARRGDRETIFRLDPSAAEHVPISASAFENRFLSTE